MCGGCGNVPGRADDFRLERLQHGLVRLGRPVRMPGRLHNHLPAKILPSLRHSVLGAHAGDRLAPARHCAQPPPQPDNNLKAAHPKASGYPVLITAQGAHLCHHLQPPAIVAIPAANPTPSVITGSVRCAPRKCIPCSQWAACIHLAFHLRPAARALQQAFLCMLTAERTSFNLITAHLKTTLYEPSSFCIFENFICNRKNMSLCSADLR